MGRIVSTVARIRFNRAGVLLVSAVLLFVVGCREKPDQRSEEYSAASFFLSRMQFYEGQFPNSRVTNLQQVLASAESPYPVRLHYQFQRFGEHAGFQNSFFEKYVLISNPISNATVGGNIVLLNAVAFPNRQGRLGRIIISKWKEGWEGWATQWYPEEQVQEFIRAAGQSIPTSVSLPPPPDLPPPHRPPLHVRVEGYFEDIAANYGPGRAAGKPLMWITFTLVTLVLMVLGLIGWRKWR